MKTLDRLLHHEGYLRALATIETQEETRQFCRHGLSHALDVARISWILVLEYDRPFSKETIYLTSLLHDIGRALDNENHDQAGAELARLFLTDCAATPTLIETVCAAITAHRTKDENINPATADLGALLALADKQSRPCFRCKAASECYWPQTLKNHSISY